MYTSWDKRISIRNSGLWRSSLVHHLWFTSDSTDSMNNLSRELTDLENIGLVFGISTIYSLQAYIKCTQGRVDWIYHFRSLPIALAEGTVCTVQFRFGTAILDLLLSVIADNAGSRDNMSSSYTRSQVDWIGIGYLGLNLKKCVRFISSWYIQQNCVEVIAL